MAQSRRMEWVKSRNDEHDPPLILYKLGHNVYNTEVISNHPINRR